MIAYPISDGSVRLDDRREDVVNVPAREAPMAQSRVDTLTQAETRLTRSFIVCAAAVLIVMFWTMFIATPEDAVSLSGLGLVLMLIQFGCYVWFAVTAGQAAKALGEPAWKYVVWILAAPLLARLPIPLVSTLIGVSPLSIRFLLGSQLQDAIRQATSIYETTESA